MANILITGSDKGLGLELTRVFLAAGDDVIATALDPDMAEELRTTKARILKLDVTRADDIASVKKELEGWSVDVLINNAGVTGYGSIGALDFDVFTRAIETNLYGPLRMIEALLENVEAGERKVIATISSGLASIADRSYTAALPYRSAKAGLNMALRCAAEDYAEKGITVLSLHPGHIRTDMGGPYATLETRESATGLKQVIDTAEPCGELRFLDWLGRPIAW